ncbi:MAG: nicotinate-nucleotide adenylyltransferase [Gammaproteobacteria bacterium]
MIGILGGSFDPIHFGHLRLALEIYEGLQLQQLRLIPSGNPPHRAAPVATATQRLDMLRAALRNEPGLCVDEREIHRSGPSYTIDTLISLRAELDDASLCLILGMDAFVRFDKWRRWREIIQLAHIVVAQRPGFDVPTGAPVENATLAKELAEVVAERRIVGAQQLADKPAGNILFWPVTQLSISSSQIRSMIAAGQSPRYLVPDAVINTIKSHGIYLNPEAHTKEETHAKN